MPTAYTPTGGIKQVLPSECRVKNTAYEAPFYADLVKYHITETSAQETGRVSCKLGDIPVMLGSDLDHGAR